MIGGELSSRLFHLYCFNAVRALLNGPACRSTLSIGGPRQPAERKARAVELRNLTWLDVFKPLVYLRV